MRLLCFQGHVCKVNPPLRSTADRLALWEAIQDGTVDFMGVTIPHIRVRKNRLVTIKLLQAHLVFR